MGRLTSPIAGVIVSKILREPGRIEQNARKGGPKRETAGENTRKGKHSSRLITITRTIHSGRDVKGIMISPGGVEVEYVLCAREGRRDSPLSWTIDSFTRTRYGSPL